MIRKATRDDLSRIAEILVFVKRMKYRSIFNNDGYSFGNLQVISVAEEYSAPEIINNIWVYEEDGIVKGLIHIEGKEVVELYVDYFFQDQGIGSKLIEFAKSAGIEIINLEVRSDNASAVHLYEKFGFKHIGTSPAFFKIDDEYYDFEIMYLDLRSSEDRQKQSV